MNKTSYQSVSICGSSRYEEKKSVFLGFCKPVETELEALEYISSIKKQYPDARHHVYAYKVRENNIIRYTDDGEPQGTAGVPILDIIQKQDLTDLCVIVIRYFGGTLLGTGGLVHAYSFAGKEAITSAKPVRLDTLQRFELTVSYSNYQKIQPILKQLQIEDVIFSDVVIVKSYTNPSGIESLKDSINEICSGDMNLKLLDQFYGIAQYL